MRIATTASPVSGSEVRERTVQLADEASRQWAENHIAAAVRGHVSRWRIRSAERSRLVRDGLGDGSRLPYQPAALNQLQQWQAQKQEQEQQRVDADTAGGSAAAAAAGSAVALAATTLAARLEDSAPRSMSAISRSGLVKNNSNISELVASKSSEPGGSGEAEAFEASTARRRRRRRSTFG